MTLAHHTYTADPAADRDPAFNADRWRSEWFRHAGSVHRYLNTGSLWLFYSLIRPDKEPVRRRLLDQLEAHPGNVAAVLEAADAHTERWERRLYGEDRDYTDKVEELDRRYAF